MRTVLLSYQHMRASLHKETVNRTMQLGANVCNNGPPSVLGLPRNTFMQTLFGGIARSLVCSQPYMDFIYQLCICRSRLLRRAVKTTASGNAVPDAHTPTIDEINISHLLSSEKNVALKCSNKFTGLTFLRMCQQSLKIKYRCAFRCINHSFGSPVERARSFPDEEISSESLLPSSPSPPRALISSRYHK